MNKMQKRSHSSMTNISNKKMLEENLERNLSKETLRLIESRDQSHCIEESKTGVSISQNTSCCSNQQSARNKCLVITNSAYCGIVYPQGNFNLKNRTQFSKNCNSSL